MRITILTMGSLGDVQPYVALGDGLQRAGHTVRLAAPAAYEAFVVSYGLEFAALPGDPAELIQGLIDRAGSNLMRQFRVSLDYALPIGVKVVEVTQKACEDADAVLSSFLMILAGHMAARERNIPDFSAQLFPVFTATSAFPAPALPALRLGSPYNRLTHGITSQVFWWSSRLGYRLLKKRLRHAPARLEWPFTATADRPATPTLYGFSRHVIPKPEDWGAGIYLTGYWFLDTEAEWQPPATLVEFLEAGPPPVYIGFGSMVSRDIARLTSIVVEALRKSGQRGILLGGWGDLGGEHLPETIFKIDSVPHDWLFPRMAAIVHHGGAGTTGASLRAGVPTVVVPFTADQPFWGRRVQALGCGPAPISHEKLRADNLAMAIQTAITDTTLRRRAAELGEAIRNEDGIANAVQVIEQTVAAFKD